jgi:hypothetical protein
MVEAFLAKLEEMMQPTVRKPDKFDIDIFRKHLETSEILMFDKTEKHIILWMKNDARLYISRNWKEKDYMEQMIPVHYREFFRILLSDITPLCRKVHFKLFKQSKPFKTE